MKICNCWFAWVFMGKDQCHGSVRDFVMYSIDFNCTGKKGKHTIFLSRKTKKLLTKIGIITLDDFFFFSPRLSICIWSSSSSQASITTYIYSRLRCTRREPNCRNAFSLSLVANTTAVTASTTIVSIIIIISFALFILSLPLSLSLSFLLLFCLCTGPS